MVTLTDARAVIEAECRSGWNRPGDDGWNWNWCVEHGSSWPSTVPHCLVATERAFAVARSLLTKVEAVEALADEWSREQPSEWARVHTTVESAAQAAIFAILADLRTALSKGEE